MSNRYIEKAFLYVLALSAILHAAVFAVIVMLPEQKMALPKEPYMVELRDLPEPKAGQAGSEKEVRRLGEEKRRVDKETAPKGERERERLASIPRTFPPPGPTRPSQPTPSPRPAPRGDFSRPQQRGDYPVQREPQQKDPSGRDVFKPRRDKLPDLAKLLPDAEKMAKIEESYRKKYGPEVEEGETHFLNTDDIQFGSFLRRFETAVYGVWRYPGDALRMGIEGTTPVRITFNRGGEVVKVEVLESSGSRILDDEVVRTLRQIGPVGSFPKGFSQETFKLIAFFHYGIVSGNRRLY